MPVRRASASAQCSRCLAVTTSPRAASRTPSSYWARPSSGHACTSSSSCTASLSRSTSWPSASTTARAHNARPTVRDSPHSTAASYS
ncbi:hypothetical protein ACFVG9_06770 [Saccharothrix carnea]|uniref:hypothetical protein n=1 Tax=Saccharothrix carnea TaxID=1280637 RepID=UPI00362DAFB8